MKRKRRIFFFFFFFFEKGTLSFSSAIGPPGAKGGGVLIHLNIPSSLPTNCLLKVGASVHPLPRGVGHPKNELSVFNGKMLPLYHNVVIP
jgi:hypothetical protein